MEELRDARTLGAVLICLMVIDFGQVDAREHHSDEQHQDAEDGVRHHNLAASFRLGATEEELTHYERGRQAA